MPLGEDLRNGRLALELTASEVAAGTHMKVQVVEALEREDFSKVAAPIYAKGFIKLYAEYVGLDPNPLTNDYVARFTKPKRKPEEEPSRPQVRRSARPATQPDDRSKVLDHELNLFSHEDTPKAAAAQAGEAAPAEKKRSGTPAADIVSSTKTALAEILKGIAEACSGLMRKTRTVFKEKATDAKKISLAETPVKIISLIVAGVIVLIFVVSILSRCMKAPSDRLGREGESGKILRVAEDPPQPYFD